jgi:hypothetical protein
VQTLGCREKIPPPLHVSKVAKKANIGAHTKISMNAVEIVINESTRHSGGLEVLTCMATQAMHTSHRTRGTRAYMSKDTNIAMDYKHHVIRMQIQ